MIFKGLNNQRVQLKITNYEFPEETTCDYDSNWLLIYLNVKSLLGNWQTIGAVLLTFEVEQIIEWFNKLSTNTIVKTSLTFIEPNLEFTLLDNAPDEKTIRILFDYEFRPKNGNDKKEYFVDCKMDTNELKSIAEAFIKELALYPKR